MLLPWLTFIVVSLIVYTGFVKLAACLLRYKVGWKSTFFFAVIMLIIVMVVHVLDFRQSAAIRIGHAALLLIGLVIMGSWFFSKRGTDRSGAVLGWRGGIRLTALAFAMMVVMAFAIVIPVQALVR